MSTHRKFVQLQTTCDDRSPLDALARQLVDGKLAGCVHIHSPITSHYRWQGQLEVAAEYEMSIKTAADLLPEVIAVLEESHPYQVPQVTVAEIDLPTSGYRDWLVEQLKSPASS